MRLSSVMHAATYRQLEKQALAVRERYGAGGQALDAARVPTALHGVVPLVELLGITDDGVRGALVDALSTQLAESVFAVLPTDMQPAVRAWRADLDAQPDTDLPYEFVAFVCFELFLQELAVELDLRAGS